MIDLRTLMVPEPAQEPQDAVGLARLYGSMHHSATVALARRRAVALGRWGWSFAYPAPILVVDITGRVKVMLLENATKYEEAISSAGERARQRARQTGAPVYYMDAAIAEGIIRELPDGSRQRVEIRGGEDVVLEELGAPFQP